MTLNQTILSIAGLGTFTLYLNNIFKIENLKNRTFLLMTHGNNILDSDKIK